MTFDSVTDSRLWLVAGWTMLHFLWTGTLVGMIAAVGRWVLHRRSANARYVFALGTLAALAVLPACIAVRMVETLPRQALATARAAETATVDLKTTEEPIVAQPFPGSVDAPALATSGNPAHGVPVRGVAERGAVVRVASLLATVAERLPWLWLIGAPLTFALLATGLVGADRLRRQSLPLACGTVPSICERLAAQLKITRRITLAVGERLASPILVGVVRPVILLPPAALAGWTPEQVEMVLLHELAHVRRWDNLVNLVQRVVESVLFFHPAVWLVSGWVRREREHCCDALVVAHTGRPEAYAETLASLAAEHPALAGASAMAKGHVLSRVRTILGKETEPMQVSRKVFGVLLLLLVTGLILVGRYAPSATGGEESAEAGYGTSVYFTNAKLSTESSSIGEYFRGVELENQKKFDEAIKHYRRAIKLDPEYAEAHASLGNTLAQLEKYESAVWHYERALKIKQGDAAIMLDESELKNKKNESKIGYYRRALGINDGKQQDLNTNGIGGVRLPQYVGWNPYGKNGINTNVATINTSNFVGIPANQPNNARQEVKKESLRYDGKSFDQWRKEFQTELKPELRREALWAFGTFGANGYGAEVAEIIVQAMRAYDVRSIDGSAEGRLKQAAIDVYVKLDQKVSVPVLVKELKEGSRRGQIFAAHVLGNLAVKGNTAIPGLIDAVLHEHGDVAGQASREFYRLGARGRVAVPRLVETLRDKGKGRNIRLQAMQALGSLGSYAKEAVPTLMEATQDEDQRISFRAILVLTTIGSPPKDAVPRFIDIVSDKESDLRSSAIYALGNIGPGASDAVPALIDVLGEKDSSLRWRTIEALGQIGPAAKDAVPALRQALPDADKKLRNQIDEALKAIEK